MNHISHRNRTPGGDHKLQLDRELVTNPPGKNTSSRSILLTRSWEPEAWPRRRTCSGRYIPSVVDGLNRGQRKILFSSFKKNLVVKHANVARLAGYVVDGAAYDHGQKSTENTIIAMAQDFVGSNNINLFEPNGQFGSRLQGGEDHADGFDIHTRLSPVARLLFREDDDIFLNYLEESARSIEPIWYIPIIPMVLVNGSRGCESNVPSYNARDIIANLRRLLNKESMEPMDPWYRGFKGMIERISTTDDGTTYTTTGAIEAVDKTTLRITELPIHCWTMDYKEFLASLDRWNDKAKEFFIEDIRTCDDHMSVEFGLSLDEKNMKIAMQEGLEKKLNLINTIGTTKMHLFDRTGLNIRKYKTPEEILEEFFDLRLECYAKRKEYLEWDMEYLGVDEATWDKGDRAEDQGEVDVLYDN